MQKFFQKNTFDSFCPTKIKVLDFKEGMFEANFSGKRVSCTPHEKLNFIGTYVCKNPDFDNMIKRYVSAEE